MLTSTYLSICPVFLFTLCDYEVLTVHNFLTKHPFKRISRSIQGFSTLISRENSLLTVHCNQHDWHCATSSILAKQRGCVSWVRSVFWKNRGKLPSSRCPSLFCLLESPRMWFARQSPLSRACLYWWRKNTHPLIYLQSTFGADHTTEKCLPIGNTLTLQQGSHTVATLLDIYCV